MHSPDPVAPLIKQLSDALRNAVLKAASLVQDDQAKALADIESSAQWQQLEPADRSPILEASGLTVAAVPSLGSDDELINALDATPLRMWAERRHAIPAKVAAARAAMAKKFEPKSVSVTTPPATLRTEADVDTYLTALREQLLRHITDGETIII